MISRKTTLPFMLVASALSIALLPWVEAPVSASHNCPPMDPWCQISWDDFNSYNEFTLPNQNWVNPLAPDGNLVFNEPVLLDDNPFFQRLQLPLKLPLPTAMHAAYSGIMSSNSYIVNPEDCTDCPEWGQGTATERRRWVVVSDFSLPGSGVGEGPGPSVIPNDHVGVMMRVRPEVDPSDPTRFGVNIEPGASQEAFLQFFGDNRSLSPLITIDAFEPDPPIIFHFPLNDTIVLDGTNRYILAFEEWEQKIGGQWVLSWQGSVWRWTSIYTADFLGASPIIRAQRVADKFGVVRDAVCNPVPTPTFEDCTGVPALPGSRILTATVFEELDVDLNVVYTMFRRY